MARKPTPKKTAKKTAKKVVKKTTARASRAGSAKKAPAGRPKAAVATRAGDRARLARAASAKKRAAKKPVGKKPVPKKPTAKTSAGKKKTAAKKTAPGKAKPAGKHAVGKKVVPTRKKGLGAAASSAKPKPEPKPKKPKLVKSPYSRQEIKPMRQALLTLRARLVGDIDLMGREALRADEADVDAENMADHGTDAFERNMTLELMENESRTLRLIDEALRTMAAGRYGLCSECEKKIVLARLEALPFAQTCVPCQEVQERGQ